VPNLVVNWNFENGNLSGYNASHTDLNISLAPEATGYRFWFRINVSNTSNVNLSVRITNVPNNENFWRFPDAHMWYSCNAGNTWDMITSHDYSAPVFNFSVSLNSTCENVQLAPLLPYDYTRMNTILQQLNSSAYVNVNITNTSYGGLDMPYLEITNFSNTQAKKKVLILSRQHTLELYSNSGQPQLSGVAILQSRQQWVMETIR
jgi:hypothetical protein